jgi:hypothetical protein
MDEEIKEVGATDEVVAEDKTPEESTTENSEGVA